MKTYGQFCPLAQASQLLCERWTFLLVRELIVGSTRFGELQKGLPLMSPTLLSLRLKQLREAGVVERQGTKGDYSYRMTAAGRDLRPLVELLGAWGHRWAPSQLGDEDLDAGLLMWDMRRTVDPTVFPASRTVVQFEYADAPKGARDWWLVSDAGEIDLCMIDPGHEVDVLIRCSLRAMTRVWTCQQSFRDAVRAHEIEALGDSKLTDRLQDWLRASGLSALGAHNGAPQLHWAAHEAV